MTRRRDPRRRGAPGGRCGRRPSGGARRLLAAALGTAALLALAAAPAAAAPGDLRAGAAESDLTPPVGTPMFAYTARSAIANPANVPGLAQGIVADPGAHYHLHSKTFVPSRGIHTRVRSRALVLERGGQKLALVQADLGGLPYALTQEVADRVAATGISLDRLLLSATHTHASTGPIWPGDSQGYAGLGGDLFDPRIFDLTAEGVAEAIVRADARLEAARLGVSTVEVRDASRNRNFEPFRRNEDVPGEEAAARQASIDPDLTVIRVDSVRGRRALAVWSNFAIHPTSFGAGNLLFSGDNAGFAARIAEAEIERRAGGGGSDVVNVWTNANEGDISPNGSPDRHGEEPLQYVNNSFGSAHLAGARVARGIVDAWHSAGEDMSRAPELSVERALVAFDGTEADGKPVGPVAALGAGGITAPDGTCAPVEDMAGPGQGRKMPQLMGAGLVPNQASVSIARVGPLGVAAFPFEITRQMGQRIRAQALEATGGRVERVALAGMTNGYLSYTATPEEYDACHYEGSFTLFGRHQGPRLRDFARELSVSLFEGGAGPRAAGEPPQLAVASEAGPPPRETPAAGEVLAEPAEGVGRLGRASFVWRGGDPALDAARGRDFVTLELRDRRGRWLPVGSDDGFHDTTARGAGDVWTETWQFTECDPLGSYRFVVRGRADRGTGVEDYTLVSRPFELGRVEGIALGEVSVEAGVARVRATYPDPGEGALLALPRFLRSGKAFLEVDGRRVEASPDPDSPDYVAEVPDGAAVVATGVEDGCGNRGAP